jgi:glycosyltransferase involved in cell wall biosynthesis
VDTTTQSPTFAVSVIIPTLNEEKLLERMLRQFTPPLLDRYRIEIVVSDGGSVDGTLAIASALAHTVVTNGAGVKQTIAMGRNLGARKARGSVFVFLNADTLIGDPEGFFATVQEEIEAPHLAALTCRVEVYPDEQRPIDRAFHGFYNWFFSKMNSVGMGMGRGECHIMTREVFTRVCGYADRIAAGEDYDMFRRLERVGRVKFLDSIVVYESPRRYRQYGYLYVTASWFLNFLAVFFLHRSILNEWKPVR